MCTPNLQERFPWMAWLLRNLAPGANSSQNQLFEHAANQGWLSWQEHGFWRVDGEWARGIPGEKIVAGHLSTVDDAVFFTMAMGELASGVNDFPLEACRKILKYSPGFQDHDAFFRRIGELAEEHYPQAKNNLETLGTAQFVNSCKLDPESFQIVLYHTDHPNSISSLGRYALSSGVQLASLLDLKAFGLWLSRQNDPAIICPTLSPFPMLFYFADQPTVVGLLSSGHPFLQLIGIMALHAYSENNNARDWHYPLGKAFAIVEQAGLEKKEFIWTVFSRLEGLKQAGENAKQHAEYQMRQGAVLKEKATKSQKKSEKLFADFEDDIATLVHHFPKKGISEQQASHILEVTRGQLELPLLVAEKLPKKATKTLAQAIFKTFHSQASIFELADDTTRYSLPYRWEQRVGYSACAFIHFHAGANLGRKFGSLAEPVENALVPFTHQPYLYHRRYDLWMHVFGKLGLLYLYTLEIAEKAVLRGEQGGEFLIQHMRKQTLELFRHYSGEYFTSLFDTLSLRVANLFLKKPHDNMTKELRTFVAHPCGYSIAKLLLLWTRPELLKGVEHRYMHLFNFFDILPHHPESYLPRFRTYVNIMDRALVAAAQMKDVSLGNHLVADWEKRFSIWKPIVAPKWSKAASWIQKALDGDEEGYRWIQDFPEFRNSMSKQYCDGRHNSNDR